MGRHQQATARQLDFDSSAHTEESLTLELEHRVSRPVPLCIVCGRHPAHLTMTRQHGHAPAKLCLRCHHTVMQHRKMLRANLSAPGPDSGPDPSLAQETTSKPQSGRQHHVSGDVGLIVPRTQSLSSEARRAALNHRRRRAQVAARRVLDLLDCAN